MSESLKTLAAQRLAELHACSTTAEQERNIGEKAAMFRCSGGFNPGTRNADAPPEETLDYRKALPHEACNECRALEARRVAVLACSVCDVRLRRGGA